MLPDFPGLRSLESDFLARRRAPPDVLAAFHDAVAVALGGAALSRGVACAAGRLAAALDEHAGAHSDLGYHGRHHFAEATRCMGWLCGAARIQGWIGAHAAELGVLAMVGHDLHHDGSWQGNGRLEAHAARLTERMAGACGLSVEDAALVGFVIRATQPGLSMDAAARIAGRLPPGPFGQEGDRLCLLATEADLFGSALPRLGWLLGEALAAERAGQPDSPDVASFKGRHAFLSALPPPSPAAVALGLPDLVAAQLRALRDAPALDQADRGPALRRYRAALART